MEWQQREDTANFTIHCSIDYLTKKTLFFLGSLLAGHYVEVGVLIVLPFFISVPGFLGDV